MEVLIALSVVILVVTALVRVVTISIRSTDYARNSSMATAYATEAMEKIRSIRDRSLWEEFTNLAGSTKYFGSGITTRTEYLEAFACPITFTRTEFAYYEQKGSLLDGIFIRCSRLDYDPSYQNIKATVTVRWLEFDATTNEDAPRKVEIVSYFYNWK